MSDYGILCRTKDAKRAEWLKVHAPGEFGLTSRRIHASRWESVMAAEGVASQLRAAYPDEVFRVGVLT